MLDEIAKLAQAAQEAENGKHGVVILVDACAIRHGVRDEVKEFCEKTGFPVYAAPMGKTAIDEDYARYGGVRALDDLWRSENVLTCVFVDLYRKPHSPGYQRPHRKREADHQHWSAQIRLQYRELHLPHPYHSLCRGMFPHTTVKA